MPPVPQLDEHTVNTEGQTDVDMEKAVLGQTMCTLLQVVNHAINNTVAFC